MSTKNKKASATGVRYSDAQKKEVVDFVAQYNSANGRGGQSAAAAKFKVTPLTISAWIKKLGAPKAKKAVKAAPVAKAVKAAAPAKAAKPAKAGKSKKGVRYNAEQKQEVVDYVASYNAANGRGGQSHAAAKFGLSVLTVATWLKNAGTSAKGTKAKAVVVKAVKAAAPAAAAVPSGLAAKVASFIAVGEQVRKAEVELQSLRAKLDSLKSSIQASL